MVWVKGKTFIQGAKSTDDYAMPREKPAHQVYVDGFFIIDEFKKFLNKKKAIFLR